jgi:hypothetical protein
VIAGAAALVGCGALFAKLVVRHRQAALFLFLSAALMGPLLNLTFTGIFVSSSDHFLYLPLWFLTLALACLARGALDNWLQQRSAIVVAAGFACLSVGMVTLRSLECRSNDHLWARELEINPNNPFVLREVAKVRASAGDLDQAAELFLRSLSPESVQYALLAQPLTNVNTYFKLLQVQGARTADGDVRSLTLLCDEMSALVEGRSGTVKGRVGRLELGQPISESTLSRMRKETTLEQFIASEAALIASRLGRDVAAERLLARVRRQHLVRVPNRSNVVLAHARIGDFEGARRRIAQLRELRLAEPDQLQAGSGATCRGIASRRAALGRAQAQYAKRGRTGGARCVPARAARAKAGVRAISGCPRHRPAVRSAARGRRTPS